MERHYGMLTCTFVLVPDVPARDEELRAMLQGIVDRLAAQQPKIGVSSEIIHEHPGCRIDPPRRRPPWSSSSVRTNRHADLSPSCPWHQPRR